MGEPYNVKAREHHGSESLDITIPAELKREYDVDPGDLFLVEAEETEDNKLILKYERIHQVRD